MRAVLMTLTAFCLVLGLYATPAAAQEFGVDLVTGRAFEPAPVPEDEECKEIKRDCGFDGTISGGTTGETLESPKNAGGCKITLSCLDAMGMPVGNPLVLTRGQTGTSFGCAAGEAINMKCEDVANHTCKLEYKDPPADTAPAEPTEF